MGSNIGVQIRWGLAVMTRNMVYSLHFEYFRKLYEEYKFPGAPIIPIFEKYFGKFDERNFTEVN